DDFANDRCFFAEPIAVGGEDVAATYYASTPIFTGCTLPIDSVGLFYTVVGNGKTLTATTCFPETNFDTQLHVYCNTCQLSCIANNDDGPGDCLKGSQVTWCSEPDQVYMIHVSGFLGDRGDFKIAVSESEAACSNAAPCATECDVPCPGGAIAENEQNCGFDYTDVTNAGCSSTIQNFTEIEPGQTICGRSGTYQTSLTNNRDVDYLRFTIEERSDVTIDVSGNFLYEAFLLSDVCATPEVFDAEVGALCQEGQLEATLDAGTYHILMRPQGFVGVSCTQSNWTISLDAQPAQSLGACCFDEGCTCQITAELFCQTSGGTFRGEGTTCETDGTCRDCPGDANGDRLVSVTDFVDVLLNFGRTGAQLADADCSGAVDVQDFIDVLLNFGSNCN
ncbi:MAG: hypothetical protein AAGB34_04660, partial [Planctomycetota bacterium]